MVEISCSDLATRNSLFAAQSKLKSNFMFEPIAAMLSDMDRELSERLKKVESNLAHLEHLYDQLNQVVLEQTRVLSKLVAQQQRISQAFELERIKATQQKPPHY